MAGQRLGDKEIAQKLGLSPRTVQNHLHRAYEKLGVSDRLQAAQKLSDVYSGQTVSLPNYINTTSDGVLVEASQTVLENEQAMPGASPAEVVWAGWRQPRKLGGSLVWLILIWAFAGLITIAVGASLANAVLEALHRLK